MEQIKSISFKDMNGAMLIKLEEIIQDLKETPCLWDRVHPDFRRVDVKDEEISRLALKHNMTVPDMARKIKYLKEGYIRQKRIKESRNGNTKKGPPWRFFDLMKFYDKNFEHEPVVSVIGTDKFLPLKPLPPLPAGVSKSTRNRKREQKREEEVQQAKRSRRKTAKKVETEAETPKLELEYSDFLLSDNEKPKKLEDSSSEDSGEVYRLSPLSCPSPSMLTKLNEHPESAALLQFIKTTTESLSTRNNSVAAYLDYLRIRFEEKKISDKKFLEFVKLTTDFVSTL